MKPKVGEIVYLRTGEDREAKFITAIVKRQGSTQYELTSGVNSSWHYNFEFSYQKCSSAKVIKGMVQ
jgi:hypothetical protein